MRKLTPNKNGKYEGIIYKRTLIAPEAKENDDFGKVYIGKSTNQRTRNYSWNNRGNKSYGGKLIMEARKKYGVGNNAWAYEVIETIETDTEEELYAALRQAEEKYIKLYKEKSFNTSDGDGAKGIKLSDKRKALIGKQHRGLHHTAETKARISAAGKGRIMPAETRKKISDAKKGKKLSIEVRRALSERRKGKVPWAATEGAKEWVKKNGGGYWGNHKLPDSARANMKATQQERGTNTRATFPDGHTEEFNTMLDAAKATGVGVGSVYHSIKHGGKCKSGHKFEKIMSSVKPDARYTAA